MIQLDWSISHEIPYHTVFSKVSAFATQGKTTVLLDVLSQFLASLLEVRIELK